MIFQSSKTELGTSAGISRSKGERRKTVTNGFLSLDTPVDLFCCFGNVPFQGLYYSGTLEHHHVTGVKQIPNALPINEYVWKILTSVITESLQ
jgi:hypothetical protein